MIRCTLIDVRTDQIPPLAVALGALTSLYSSRRVNELVAPGQGSLRRGSLRIRLRIRYRGSQSTLVNGH